MTVRAAIEYQEEASRNQSTQNPKPFTLQAHRHTHRPLRDGESLQPAGAHRTCKYPEMTMLKYWFTLVDRVSGAHEYAVVVVGGDLMPMLTSGSV